MEPLAIGYICGGIIFAIFTGIFTWLYFSNKSEIRAFREQRHDYVKGSYKHFWYRNKDRVFIFLLWTCFLISIAFFGLLFGISISQPL